jgi:hypothetical protein
MEHGIARRKDDHTMSWSFHMPADKACPRLRIHLVDGNPSYNDGNHISKVRRKSDHNVHL